MRRLALTGVLFASTAVGACSLINAPADVIPGGGGAGGMPGTSTVTSTATSSTSSTASVSSSGTGGAGGSPCTVQHDCDALTDQCNDGACNAGACVAVPKE